MAESMRGGDEVHRADDVGREGSRLSGRQIAALILVGVLVVVSVLNLDQVSIDLIVGSIELPLVVVIVVSGFVGFLIGWLFFRRREKRRLEGGG